MIPRSGASFKNIEALMYSGPKPLAKLLRRARSLPANAYLLSFAAKRANPSKSGDSSALLEQSEKQAPRAEVPRGHLAVYVGPEMQRFVIPASYLNLPAFRKLMERAEEEFGFEQTGGLRIPCEEEDFEEILRMSKNHSRKIKKH